VTRRRKKIEHEKCDYDTTSVQNIFVEFEGIMEILYRWEKLNHTANEYVS
jgi:hypothetical protein